MCSLGVTSGRRSLHHLHSRGVVYRLLLTTGRAGGATALIYQGTRPRDTLICQPAKGYLESQSSRFLAGMEAPAGELPRPGRDFIPSVLLALMALGCSPRVSLSLPASEPVPVGCPSPSAFPSVSPDMEFPSRLCEVTARAHRYVDSLLLDVPCHQMRANYWQSDVIEASSGDSPEDLLKRGAQRHYCNLEESVGIGGIGLYAPWAC